MEPRTGGRWYEIGEDGTECEWGNVLAWDPPRRILLTWQINGNFEIDRSAVTELEVNFIPDGVGTRVELEHRGFENYATTGQQLRDSVGGDGGWGGLLQLMATAVEAPVPLRYFVCKLIPPRPTFMQDMSDAEGEALRAHIGYWKSLLSRKKTVIFGPVGDPAGVWGLGILAVAEEGEAHQLASADPAITSGLGFRHEVFPMLQAVM